MGEAVLPTGHRAVAEQLGVPVVVEVDQVGCGVLAQAVALAGVGVEDQLHEFSRWW